jgi:hypothetical protein
MFLNIIHRLSLSKNMVLFIFQKNVSEAEFYLRLQAYPALSPEIGTSSIDWIQLSRFYLNSYTESSLRNVVVWKINGTVFLDKDRMMDNDQKRNICNKKISFFSSPPSNVYRRLIAQLTAGLLPGVALLLTCTISSSHSGGYEEFYLLEYNAVYCSVSNSDGPIETETFLPNHLTEIFCILYNVETVLPE